MHNSSQSSQFWDSQPVLEGVLSHQRSPAGVVLLVGVGALVQQLLHSLHVPLQDQEETNEPEL